MVTLEDKLFGALIVKTNTRMYPSSYKLGDEYVIYNFFSSKDPHMKDFIRTPFYIPAYYMQNKKKVFPLYSMEKQLLCNAGKNKNPFFDRSAIQYSVVYDKKGRPVGRVASFIDFAYNEENEKIGEDHLGWIGFFESIDDILVGKGLLESAEDFLQFGGANQVLATAQFNANGEIGLLVNGFENAPFFMEPYNPSYYKVFFEKRGYKVREFKRSMFEGEGEKKRRKGKDVLKRDKWYSFVIDLSNLSEKHKEYIDLARKGFIQRNGLGSSERDDLANDLEDLEDSLKKNYRRYILREINPDSFKEEAIKIFELYNAVWGKGPHPEQRRLRWGEVKSLMKDLRLIVFPEYVIITEYESSNSNREVIGTLVACLNINETINQYDAKWREEVSALFEKRREDKAYGLIDRITKKLWLRDLGILKTHINKIKNTYRGDEKSEFALFPPLLRLIEYFPSKRARELKDKKYESARVLILGLKEGHRKRLVAENMMIRFLNNLREKTPSVKKISGSEIAEINLDMFLMLQKIGEIGFEWNVYHREIEKEE